MPLTREEHDFVHSATSYFRLEREFTMRDKFAIAAMQTMLETQDNKMTYEDIADLAYNMADIMIKTRNKRDREKNEKFKMV